MEEKKILFNRARCRRCGTFLESKTVHDFRTCACGAISIDGGREYIHHVAVDWDLFEDLCEYEDLIDPKTGQPAHRCDYATRVWFQMHSDMETTLVACEKCGLLYKPSRKHLHKCDDLIDPHTGALLHPGVPDLCPGNGRDPDYECCCDRCDYWYECNPDWHIGAIWDETERRWI